jgi:hypothetical protein
MKRMFTFDDVKHENSDIHITMHMATQQLEECKIAYSLEDFLREPQHYVELQ